MHRRAERAWLWLAVVGVHALLLLVLRSSLLPRPRGEAPAAPSVPLVVRLIAALPATPAAQPAAAEPRLPSPRVRKPALAPPSAAVGQAITLAPPALDAPSPAASVPEPSIKLDLTLPRRAAAASAPRAMHDQMLNDPRSNSARATVESRIAAVAGSVDLTEERMDASRMRVKQRGGCVEVHVSRNAQIDPFNQSVSPTPKVVKPSC